ncbi:MAG: sigma-70 family RNA polymerase sigma factor [Planctomycetota bacterium]
MTEQSPPSASAPESHPNHATDLQLVRCVLRGDRPSIEELARRTTCVARILAALNRRRGGSLNEHDLEDLAQDTLVKIWAKLAGYRGHVTFELWARRFCELELQNRLRAKARARVRQRPLPEELQQGAPRHERGDSRRLLRRHLAAVGDPDSTILELRIVEQRSFDEIGRELSRPPGTVRTRYHRVLARLRTRLQPLEESLTV